MFEVKDLSASWKTKDGNLPVFSNVSFTLPSNALTVLCGVNGSGKSTLLSVISGQIPAGLKVEKGTVLVEGTNIYDFSPKERAKKLSFLVQKENLAWDITARTLVENGRYAYQNWYGSQSLEDTKIVDETIKSLGLWELQNRSVFKLSGGELQRFRIARALVQQTSCIFMDEPLAALDLNFQKELIVLLKQLCTQGKTICISIHDLNLASICADNMIFMKKDRSGIFEGSPQELMTDQVLKESFGSDFEIFTHPVTGSKQIW